MSTSYSGSKARVTKLAAVFIAAVLATGCTSTMRVNDDLFSNADDFQQKVSSLYKGMSEEEFLDVFGDKVTERWQSLDNTTINAVICGCQPNLDTYADVKAAADDLLRTKGYSIEFESTDEKWSLGLLTTNTKTTGDEVTLNVVFRDGELVAWEKNGGPVNEKKKKPMINDAGDLIKLGV
jgi:hypothetical protein